ncbi:hypothetical protein BGZ60DRAFT_427820 [Tricladium varicosporioides]|nr:hypothetical protein BGZ60DRAFT_427820 [Hymenoscyphus varicosporioides]
MQFIAIEICIRYGHEVVGGREKTREEKAKPNESKATKRKVRPTKTSILRDWYTGTYTEIANIKRGYIVGFEDIVAEFAPEFIVRRLVSGPRYLAYIKKYY